MQCSLFIVQFLEAALLSVCILWQLFRESAASLRAFQLIAIACSFFSTMYAKLLSGYNDLFGHILLCLLFNTNAQFDVKKFFSLIVTTKLQYYNKVPVASTFI